MRHVFWCNEKQIHNFLKRRIIIKRDLEIFHKSGQKKMFINILRFINATDTHFTYCTNHHQNGLLYLLGSHFHYLLFAQIYACLYGPYISYKWNLTKYMTLSLSSLI
jgi:hypothetical protein